MSVVNIKCAVHILPQFILEATCTVYAHNVPGRSCRNRCSGNLIVVYSGQDQRFLFAETKESVRQYKILRSMINYYSFLIQLIHIIINSLYINFRDQNPNNHPLLCSSIAPFVFSPDYVIQTRLSIVSKFITRIRTRTERVVYGRAAKKGSVSLCSAYSNFCEMKH